MAIDVHIRFDGVEGESTDRDHKGEVRVLTWGWGVTQAAAAAGAGSGTGKATPADLVFTHDYDKASPLLARRCAQGKHFPTVVLSARKSGEGQKDFLKVTMKEVFITSIQVVGQGEGGLQESVSLRYGTIEFGYKPQDARGGLGAEVKFNWDLKTGKVT
jgi:type VI secretion system secreted protein Hcp